MTESAPKTKEYKGPSFAAGKYDVEITAQRFIAVGKNETPAFQVDFKVLALIDPVSNKPTAVEKQYERQAKMFITSETMDFFPDQLRALGFTGGDFKSLEPTSKNHVSLVGNKAQMLCKHNDGFGEKYAGKKVEDWQVLAGKQRERAESDASVAAKLNTLFGSQLKKAFGAAPTKPAESAPAVNEPDDPPFDDDDVQF